MMEIMLDGVLTRGEVSADNLIQLVNNYLTACFNQDRVIKSFKIDGVEVEKPLEAIKINIQNNNIDNIEVVTQNKAELMYDTAQTAHEFMPELISAVAKISSDINHGKGLDGALWQQVLGGLDWMTGICSHLNQNFDLQPSNEISMDKGLDELNAILSSLIGSLESGDFVSIGDILEYELIGQLKTLKDILAVNLAMWDIARIC